MTSTRGVPLCDVLQQYRQLESEIQEAVLQVLASGKVILGPEVRAFEQEIANYCGAGHAVGCASGTDALSLALQAIGIGPGDEVIVPTFTFFATVGSVCRLGAQPVFADIDPISYNLDPNQVEDKINYRTRAILPVHLFGQTADMEPLWQIAEQYQLPIIEDAAQALGAEYQQKRTGTLGAMACYSFYPSKNLGAAGDGGMVVTTDPEWAEVMVALRGHGMRKRYHHSLVGWNSRLDEVQAAILRIKLPYLESWTKGRQKAAKRYDSLIEEYGLQGLMTRPAVLTQRRHVFNQYVVRVDGEQRDPLFHHLRNDQIGCEIYYPIPVHLQECMRYLGYNEGEFPISEEASQTVLALPMFPEITEDQQRMVMESCTNFLKQRRRLVA